MNAKFPDNPLLGPQSRADFITANLPLVKFIVERHFLSSCRATNTPPEDAVSEGTVGLIRAYDRYDDVEVPFASFAFKYISGEIRNSFSRRPSFGIRIPHGVFPLVKRINSAGLAEESAEFVAEELGVTVRKARDALHCARIVGVSALPEIDERGRADDYTNVDTDVFIARLKPKPQRVIRLLMAEHTQTEVAHSLGMTRQSINVMVRRVRDNYEAYEKIGA